MKFLSDFGFLELKDKVLRKSKYPNASQLKNLQRIQEAIAILKR